MKKIIQCFIFSFPFGGIGFSSAQINIIANPSFEDTVRCPNTNAQMIIPSACKDWYDPNGSTSEYYNSCTTHLVGVPSNFGGWQYARTGFAYAGFVSYPAREYIQERLDSILYPNHIYCIEFYVNLANEPNIAANNMGMYISDTPPPPPSAIPTNLVYNNCIPQVNDTVIISDTLGWTKVSGEYAAHGGEEYITIGNFYTNAHTDTMYIAHHPFADIAYYYVDDVSIVDCTPGLGINEVKEEEVNIFPNPATNILRIDIQNYVGQNATLNINDVLGQSIFNSKKNSKTTTVDITSYPSGVYFLSVKDENKIINRKFVKE